MDYPDFPNRLKDALFGQTFNMLNYTNGPYMRVRSCSGPTMDKPGHLAIASLYDGIVVHMSEDKPIAFAPPIATLSFDVVVHQLDACTLGEAIELMRTLNKDHSTLLRWLLRAQKYMDGYDAAYQIRLLLTKAFPERG